MFLWVCRLLSICYSVKKTARLCKEWKFPSVRGSFDKTQLYCSFAPIKVKIPAVQASRGLREQLNEFESAVLLLLVLLMGFLAKPIKSVGGEKGINVGSVFWIWLHIPVVLLGISVFFCFAPVVLACLHFVGLFVTSWLLSMQMQTNKGWYPQQDGCGSSRRCAAPRHPWSKSAQAGMTGDLFDRVCRVGEDRTLLYWVCSVSSTCAGWQSTHMATRRSPARRRNWARMTSAWCHETLRRRTRWMWWVAHLSPPRSTTSTTTSRACRWAAGAPRAPSSTWRTRTHAIPLPTMAISTHSQGRVTSSQTSSSTACHCQRWDTIQCALSLILSCIALAVRSRIKGEIDFSKLIHCNVVANKFLALKK